MALFKKDTMDWKEKYRILQEQYDKFYEEKRELKKKVQILEDRFKKTGYLEPKQRQIKTEQILQIKALKKNEGLSCEAIAKETGWSKATVWRALNGKYD